NKMINAGDNSIDAAIVYLTSMPALIADAGKLTDLSAVSTLNTSASWWDQNAVTEFTLGGQMKLLVGDLNLYNTFSPIMYFFNKNVANQYDLGNLYDLVRDGKWTNDKMMEFSKITAADLNGDGAMDENDRFGLAEQLNLLKHFITAGGQRFSSRDKDGNVILTLNTETTAGIVETIVPFLNDKKVCNAANHYKSKYSNVFRELHVPMLMNDQLLFNMNQLLIAFELREMEADFGVLPCPKADEAQSFYSTPVETWWATCICIPEMCSRKEDTGYVLDAMGYYSQKLVTPAFVDQTVTSKSLRDEDSEEMLHLIMDSRYYDVALIYDWGNYTQVVTTLGESGKTNFASAYEKAEKRILSALEKTMGQLNEQN
ncbi:MAG: hypothetical protein MJ175_11985, partial [Clostridia bacterium]|nr:hypothetical protein [Clostridia bacterium]